MCGPILRLQWPKVAVEGTAAATGGREHLHAGRDDMRCGKQSVPAAKAADAPAAFASGSLGAGVANACDEPAEAHKDDGDMDGETQVEKRATSSPRWRRSGKAWVRRAQRVQKGCWGTRRRMAWRARCSRWWPLPSLLPRGIRSLRRDSGSSHRRECIVCSEVGARRTFSSWNGSSSILPWNVGRADVVPR